MERDRAHRLPSVCDIYVSGSIAFPHLSDDTDSEVPAKKLVAEAGVLLLLGKYYDYNPSNFRIGFGRANRPEALERLEACMDGRRG